MKLNYSKTEILQLGNISYSKSNPFKLKWVKEKVYALGTWFYKDTDLITEFNYKFRCEQFHSVLNYWKKRHLTLLGKITVVKSLALSKLNYCISTLETPEWFTKEIQLAIIDFIWDGKPPRVKLEASIATREDGGLRIPHVQSYILAQKAMWVKRLLECKSSHFCSYLSEFLPEMEMKDILSFQ